jgi:hypothetical protein
LPGTDVGSGAHRRCQQANNRTRRLRWRRRRSTGRANNRPTDQQAASNEVVEKLFGVKPRAMKFNGCLKREEGDFECLYEDKKNGFTMAILVTVSRRGYRIGSLSFSSEAQ